MLLYQGMVVLAGSQVWWTWEVEDVFNRVKKGDKLAMKNYAKKMHTQINDLVVKVGVIYYSHDSICYPYMCRREKVGPRNSQIFHLIFLLFDSLGCLQMRALGHRLKIREEAFFQIFFFPRIEGD